MDNEEELLGDSHFKDCGEFDDLDEDAEDKLLGLSDDEDNVEYEYVDEDGKPVDINENNESEYEVVKDDAFQNQNEQDVLDLEVDHDLEFDESSLNEGALLESSQRVEEPVQPDKSDEADDDYQQTDSLNETDNGKLSDSSESDNESEEAGRGRFRSERPNVVQLVPRTNRTNIPDSLDDVIQHDSHSGSFRQQRGLRRDTYNRNQHSDRNKRDFSSNADYESSREGIRKGSPHSQNLGVKSTSTTENTWSADQAYSSNVQGTDSHTGPRKILINPHFKGTLPSSTTATTQNLWCPEQNQMNTNFNNSYRPNAQLPNPLYNQVNYDASSERGPGLALPNQLNVPPPMRPQLLNAEPIHAPEFQWNRNPFHSPPPAMPPPPPNLMTGSNRMIDTPPMLFPPPLRERPPPLIPNNTYFNENQPFQVRPAQPPNPQWNTNTSYPNFDQFNSFNMMPTDTNTWRPSANQNSSLLGNPPLMPNIRQPPPLLQMQQPRPLMSFNNSLPNFSNLRPESSSNTWTSQQPTPRIPSVNNYLQMRPPLINNQNKNSIATSLPFRLPLPTPNVSPIPRALNTKLSLLGSPVMMGKQRSPNFNARASANPGMLRQEAPNWVKQSSTQPATFRKRILEDTTGIPLKHQRTTTFVNKQNVVLRRKPTAVNANIKEVKIVSNLSNEEATTKPPTSEKPEIEEDEETKKYRAQIELLNQKRAEILRIKEERREIMARQRRKLLEQQQSQPSLGLDGNLGVPGSVDTRILKPNALAVKETPAVIVGSSPLVKKKVIVRRVTVTPRPPRKLISQTTVNQSYTSAVPILGSVIPRMPNSGLVATAARLISSRVLNKPIDVIAQVQQSADVKMVQTRQLRTVVLNKNPEPVKPQVPKQNLQTVKINQTLPKKVTRVVLQSGASCTGESSKGDGFQGQRVMVEASPMSTTQTSVLIENLSLATTEVNLKQLCQLYGEIHKIELKKETRTALVKFAHSQNAKLFVEKCQRRMVDLSLITLTLLN